jgi:pyridoxine/pyridoxamine 5'-phosphate oxidase
MRTDRRHGGPYDRGSADSYYRRPRRPHFFTEATYASDEIEERFMTKQQIAEYNLGFDDNEQSGNFKDWG